MTNNKLPKVGKLPQVGDLLVWYNADPFTGAEREGTALCIETTFDKSGNMDSCTFLFNDEAEPWLTKGFGLIEETFRWRAGPGLSLKVVSR